MSEGIKRLNIYNWKGGKFLPRKWRSSSISPRISNKTTDFSRSQHHQTFSL